VSHPDLDTEPSKCPFDRYPVTAYKVEQGTFSEERFYVLEIDLPNDNLGPMKMPTPMSEADARVRLAVLGLLEAEIEQRINWAKHWMATVVSTPGKSVLWLPPL
jgi:hypothetical protein